MAPSLRPSPRPFRNPSSNLKLIRFRSRSRNPRPMRRLTRIPRPSLNQGRNLNSTREPA